MHKLHELRERLMGELEEYVKKDKGGEMTPACLDTVYKLVESIKGIDKIFMLNGEEEPEYSQRYYNAGGNSYARSRDRMGRYSGNRWVITSNSSRPHYSRNDRKSMLLDSLEELKSRAPSEKALDAIETVMATVNLDD